MKIIFYGAAREVGKSCIEIQSEGQRYLLDAGVKFIQGGIEYPKILEKIRDVDGVFLSHAHMDHSGALPLLEHRRLNCPIYTTPMTWEITNMLLKDAYHLAKMRPVHPAYDRGDLSRVQEDVSFVKYDEWYPTRDGKARFQYINSGHIPGGASILFELEGKRLLYTSDINTQDTLLMVPSNIEETAKDIDILITENTYGSRMHPDRAFSQECLLKSINTCLDGGGSALIPVFGVGRSQEVLMMLDAIDEKVPIYLDGMARRLTDVMLRSDDPYVDKKELLAKVYRRVHLVKSNERSRIAHKKGAVIVSTSGMIQGGPSVLYVEKFKDEKRNFIIFTGYQAEGTNGRSIFEDHLFYHNKKSYPVKCHVRKFDFSAHYGQDAIHRLLENIAHEHLILQHGDPNSIDAVALYAKNNLKSKVYVPQLEDVLEF